MAGVAAASGLEVHEAGRALRVQTEAPHLVSMGSGRLSTAVTLHPLPEGRRPYRGPIYARPCPSWSHRRTEKPTWSRLIRALIRSPLRGGGGEGETLRVSEHSSAVPGIVRGGGGGGGGVVRLVRSCRPCRRLSSRRDREAKLTTTMPGRDVDKASSPR